MPGKRSPGLQWISSSTEIMRLRKSGRLFRGKHIFLWVLDEPEGGLVPKVAIVNGRGFRGAVGRNRARRRVRGGVLERRELLEPGKSYLVEARRGAEEGIYQKLVFEIDGILSEARNCVKKQESASGKE